MKLLMLKTRNFKNLNSEFSIERFKLKISYQECLFIQFIKNSINKFIIISIKTRAIKIRVPYRHKVLT